MKYLLLIALVIFSYNSHAESSCEAYRPYHNLYNITGPHAGSMCTCSACHLGGVWKGTPNTCNGCHTGTRGIAIGKPATHIPTTLSCDVCHAGILFQGGVVIHNATNTPPGTCLTCHNGAYASQGARGKPSDHLQTTLSCDACHHSFSNWSGGTFNHAGVVKGTCATCHNGVTATGTPPRHILTGGLSCDVCHLSGYSTFQGGIYTHSGTEQCEGCHTPATSGTTVKPANHPITPDNCTSCHSITGWPCKTGQIMKKYLDKMIGVLHD